MHPFQTGTRSFTEGVFRKPRCSCSSYPHWSCLRASTCFTCAPHVYPRPAQKVALPCRHDAPHEVGAALRSIASDYSDAEFADMEALILHTMEGRKRKPPVVGATSSETAQRQTHTKAVYEVRLPFQHAVVPLVYKCVSPITCSAYSPPSILPLHSLDCPPRRKCSRHYTSQRSDCLSLLPA